MNQSEGYHFFILTEDLGIVPFEIDNLNLPFTQIIDNLIALRQSAAENSLIDVDPDLSRDLIFYNGYQSIVIDPQHTIGEYLIFNGSRYSSIQTQVLIIETSDLDNLSLEIVLKSPDTIPVIFIDSNLSPIITEGNINSTVQDYINVFKDLYQSDQIIISKIEDEDQRVLDPNNVLSDLLPPRRHQILFYISYTQTGWYQDCANRSSLISLEEWNESQIVDYIKIYRVNSKGQLLDNPTCYNRQNVIRFTSDNVFAEWVKKPQVKALSISGLGGHPGREHFYRLISGEFIDYQSYLLLHNNNIDEYIIQPKIINQRLGNLMGRFGLGEHHGQSPGFTIYSLRPRPN